MTDGGQDFNLGHVVGTNGSDGDDGSTIWYTTTAPTYASSKYTFTISNLTGKTGFTIAVNDLIFYNTYYYIVSAVNSSTVDCTVRVSIKGATGNNGTNGTNGTNGVGIASISKTGTSGKVDTYTITYTNSDTDTFTVTNGNDGANGTNGTNGTNGADGVGISNIAKTSSSGKVDTYTITLSNGTTKTFTVTNGNDGTNGTNGTDGTDGIGITNIAKTGTSGLVDTYTITLSNGTTKTFTVTNGAKGDTGATGQTGATGKGISSISKTGTSGLVDTYTITYSDNTTSTFTVTNGSNASVTVVDNLTSDSSTSVLSAKQGKVLNTNKVETSAIKSSFSATTLDTNIASEKLVKTELDKKITKASSATGLLKDDGTVMTSGTGSSNYAAGNHTHSAYVNPTIVDNLTSDSSTSVLSAKQGKVLNTNKIETSAIADNLTTNDATKVLSAKQGKVLNDMIGSAITYITGSGS